MSVNCLSQETDTAEGFPRIELNGQSLDVVEKCGFLGDTVGASGGAVE